MSSRLSNTRLIELDLIKKDAYFYFDIMPKLIPKQSSGVLFFGFMPYLSLFTVETHKYLQSTFPSYAQILLQDHFEIINSSRMRIKYFDDTKKNVDGTFELLRWIIDFNEEWFIRGHKGWLAPIKRALQSDLGIFLYGDHIIGSTHIEMFNMGYGKKDLPETSSEISKELRLLSRTIGESLGRYLGQLCSFPEFIPDNSLDTAFSYNINDKKLKYKDVKSKKFFNTIFNSNETIDINFSLSLFLSSLNFLQHIFRNILFGSPPTMFKLKFITLFHLASSLEKLRNYYYPKGILTSRSVKYLQEILGDDNLKVVSRQKKFRNNMVHYKIDGVAEELLNQNVNLYGLIEYYFDGKSYDDVDKIIDYQIERISAILEEWLTWKLTSNQLSSW